MIISPSVLKMRNVSNKCCRENQNTHFTFNNFFRILCCLWVNVEKYCRAGQVTDDNMAHVHCVLDPKGYRHIGRKSDTYCFSTARMVAWMCRSVTLYVHSFQQKSRCLKFLMSRSGSYVTCSSIIILVVLLSAYLCIRGISLSSILYNQSRRVYVNKIHQYIRLIWS
jgi:hypothetical protein